MESEIKIKASLAAMNEFFEENAVCSVRHFKLNGNGTFTAIIRHAERDKYLDGTYTIPQLIAELLPDTIAKNSPVVDMILRRKTAEAARNAIKVICNYETESVLPIDDISLCLIFGNAMDNAIDACLKLPEGKDRRIDIDVRYENNRLTIRIANTSGPVNIVNNACATTKRNSMLHGYGLLNIQKTVVEKGGNSVIHYDDDMFILSIIFLL